MIFALSISLALLSGYLLWRQKRIHQEIDEFTESILNKDLSRKYPENGFNKRIHKQLNTTTSAFLNLTSEKEAQQHYLKKILELVDTGILAYDVDTHDVLWVNDAFAAMLTIPHVKNINRLKKLDETIFNEIENIPLNKRCLITIQGRKQTVKTMTNASLFETGGKTYKLIAFHNVSSTMEEVESEAWKGLLNVMTHEIMNSIVPVSSLSDTLTKKIQALKEANNETVNPEFEDIELALATIHRRSEGLLRFAETYRNLSQKIIPHMQWCNLYELLHSIHSLMLPSMQQKGISFSLNPDHHETKAYVDRDLIEQVVINFITNATHAVSNRENPKIHLFTGSDKEGRPYITVADNGKGISDDIRSKIFIPFFSTRKNGNGIGLSISRQIAKLHHAEILIQSKENKGTAFTLLFG